MEQMYSSEPNVLMLTEREMLEIRHALYYTKYLNHGTVGHNVLVLLAKFAQHVGFDLDHTAGDLVTIPDSIAVVK